MNSAIKSLYQNRDEKMDHLTLKQFAKLLLDSSNETDKAMAKSWFANKGGASIREAQKKRLATKGGKLIEIRMNVKASRRKNSQNQSAKSEVAKKVKGQ
jgi:hypothetical protein